MRAAELGKGIEADSQDERSDPTEDLGMAVRLNPSCRNGVRRAVAADRQQIPDTKKRSRKQHEEQARADIKHQQARERGFAGSVDPEDIFRTGPAWSLFFDYRRKWRHESQLRLGRAAFARGPNAVGPSKSVGLFHFDRPGKQDVIFQVNVLMQVSLELCQSFIKGLVTDAGVEGSCIALADFFQRVQGVAGGIMLRSEEHT